MTTPEQAEEQRVDEIMKAMPESWRMRWCQAKQCYCMGCVNMRGVTKQEWEKWKQKQK